jgi:Leucine-rich repeat (LRR) protein
MASLASLALLTELSLQGCTRLTSRALPHLGRLTKLVSLDLSTCRGVASLAPLRTLAQLERLLLGWTAVTDEDMQHVAFCGSLTNLQLCRTRVGDAGVAALAGRLPLLRQLDLTGCRVSDASSAALASFARLNELSLAGCSVSSAALRELGSAALELSSLSMAHTGVTDDGLRDSVAPLSRLASLDLECCSVTDAGVAALRGCLNLNRLVLSDTATSNAGLRALVGVPLHTLSLSFTGVTDVGLAGLSPALEDLRLDTRGITDAGLRQLGHLTRLRRLDLFGARVSDSGLPYLLVLRHSLRELDICGGGLTDAGMPAIAALTLLERLNLSQNWRVTDESVPHLCTLRQLRSLSLSGTGITGAGVLLFAVAPPRLEALAVYGCDVAREAEQVQAARPPVRVTWTETETAL